MFTTLLAVDTYGGVYIDICEANIKSQLLVWLHSFALIEMLFQDFGKKFSNINH